MKNLALLSICLLIVFGCAKKENKLFLVDSNGRMNQVLVVMNHDLFTGLEGEELSNVTDSEVLGLPQPEPQFKVTQIPVNAYKNLFLSQRNVLHVTISDSTYFNVQKNVYAKPQTIITICGKDSESLINEIRNRKIEIIQTFKRADIKAVQQRLQKKPFDTKKLKTLTNLGIELKFSTKYKLVDDTGDFLWLRQHLTKGESMNVLVYELPINSIEDEEGKNINSVRDTIGKKYIPGTFENSYYITEQAYTPDTFLIELDGKKTYETRGKWEVKNDYMAGPFLNYTVVDKANNRLVVVEGFTYAPAASKRDYMFELEAVLKTLKIK
ncbi:MAG: DUF4837 family protein [Urechidicola sp.]|nr:DUF4837 family protein [Urechidicola sp.]